MNLGRKEIWRQVQGRQVKTTADRAMRMRSLPGQYRADEPPESPKGYNTKNPDPLRVCVPQPGGSVRMVPKSQYDG